ncbi:MAG: L-threonylcarbamoyladenylate synthase [Halanaerobiales bacterium]
MNYNTSIVKIPENLLIENNIDKIIELPVFEKASKLLKRGETVAFPTETVYGLGADARNPEAVKRIFKAKGRPQDNPLIVHIANFEQFEMVKNNNFNLDDDLFNILKAFWPGPLTVILPKSKLIADRTTANLQTVGIRMPSHPVSLSLIESSDTPLAAPSANISGFPSPTTAHHVYEDLKGKIPLIIDGGHCKVGVESTIIKIKDEEIIILRPGGISREELANISKRKIKNNEKNIKDERKKIEQKSPIAPGMKYKHYSPETKLILYKSNFENLFNYITKNSNKKLALVMTKESIDKLKRKNDFDFANIELLKIGSLNKIRDIANRLFYTLRELDKAEFDLIIIEKIPEKGIGEAVMNRIYKATSDLI